MQNSIEGRTIEGQMGNQVSGLLFIAPAPPAPTWWEVFVDKYIWEPIEFIVESIFTISLALFIIAVICDVLGWT